MLCCSVSRDENRVGILRELVCFLACLPSLPPLLAGHCSVVVIWPLSSVQDWTDY